jgi:hypothetical protein
MERALKQGMRILGGIGVILPLIFLVRGLILGRMTVDLIWVINTVSFFIPGTALLVRSFLPGLTRGRALATFFGGVLMANAPFYHGITGRIDNEVYFSIIIGVFLLWIGFKTFTK